MNIRCLAHTARVPALPSAAAAAFASALLLLSLGCASSSPPPPETETEPAAALPSQTTTTDLEPLELPPAPALPPPIREVEPTRSSGVQVIDPGGTGQPQSLIEASRMAKRMNRNQRPATVEINDENLAEYAEGGQLIVMESGPAAPPPTAAPAPADDAPSVAAAAASARRDADARSSGEGPPALSSSDETGWRNRGLGLRMAWRNALDTTAELELEAAALRQRFYAEDDPYVRDGQIKPAWDRTLDRLQMLRGELDSYEARIGDFLVDGRRAGIPPGWLREGWELEPSEEERRAYRNRDAIVSGDGNTRDADVDGLEPVELGDAPANDIAPPGNPGGGGGDLP
ncbi:MAG: hypothetical protein AAF772_01905 [Acidobacteriota bacterium]